MGAWRNKTARKDLSEARHLLSVSDAPESPVVHDLSALVIVVAVPAAAVVVVRHVVVVVISPLVLALVDAAASAAVDAAKS